MIKKSIRNWLIAPLIGFFILPLFLVAAFLSWHNYVLEKENVKNLQHKLTVLASENISFFLHEQETVINSMLRTNYDPDLPYSELKILFSKFMASFRDARHGYVFKNIALLNPRGREVMRISRNELVMIEDLRDLSTSGEYIQAVSQNGFHYSPVHFENTGEPVIKVSIALRDLKTLTLQGVLLAEMRLGFLWQYISDMKIGEQGIAYLTNSENRIIAHPNRSIILKNTSFPVPDEPAIMHGITGMKAVVAAEKVKFGNQVVKFVTEVPTAEALEHIRRSFMMISAFLLFTMAGAIMLVFVIVNRVVRPVESLAGTARKITEGDLTQKAESGNMDELGDLALAFNTMTARLVETIEEVRSEKDFVNKVIESMTHPFYVIDVRDYSIKLANSAAKFGSYGKNDTCYKLTHNSDSPCTGADHPCPLEQIKATHKPVMVEHVHEGVDNKKRTFEVYGFPLLNAHGELVQVIEHNIDVTERKNLEMQLMQSQKLEAIGILTGGVAHDFNNLLTTIIGYSEIILMDLNDDDPLYQKIKPIFDAGHKASGLTRQLLAFSRKQVMEMKAVDLNKLIENMLKMLERLIGEQITIRTSLKSFSPVIMADPNQVEQIIMNLAINAKDAMPDGGTLFFETDTVELDGEYCRNHPKVDPGTYVAFYVTDTGKGMPSEVKEHIFDPFFTTKKKGEGTGLGLSTAYGIIRQLNGDIMVYSEAGFGTTFKLLFPVAETEGENLEIEALSSVEGGTEKLLVVDDEPSIRKLVCDTLGLQGYKVYCAESGEEALDFCLNGEEKIDLLLTDVIMPGMNGKELADILMENYPDLKVIYMSGYSDNIITHHGVLDPELNFINKPLVPSMLISRIREVLDERS